MQKIFSFSLLSIFLLGTSHVSATLPLVFETLPKEFNPEMDSDDLEPSVSSDKK